ncbi:AAA family ATPase [Bradyrhizobium sp. HKCCYLRH2015]|uniref:AAA family ATPase n=1 Tax=Bradyrhizobium sp. HKCCYLRH2015 TaxID=3420742 RepID=UPI003EBF64A0
MLTRIEIDGFKSFEGFGLNLRPLTAVVGPNASGKSNLFDALRFLSSLVKHDIRTAMQDLRGEPEELFRKTPAGQSECMSFAVEVLLPRKGIDAFGTSYEIVGQRLRYELKLALSVGSDGNPKGVYVREERCTALAKKNDRASFLAGKSIKYNSRVSPYIEVEGGAILVRQDGRQKHGRPVQLSLKEASRTALSTITTSEFPHLYALRESLSAIKFLEINPKLARSASDRYEDHVLKPDASNLAAVLARLKEATADKVRPKGVLSDIAADLASLIPSVSRLIVHDDAGQKQYSFTLQFADQQVFSSRVISDGTLRLLALLTVLHDPDRKGTLCFEEPENGVHEGRVPMLVEYLRLASELPADPDDPTFQVLLNTHSPRVMSSLNNEEIVAADTVAVVDPKTKSRVVRTRMRSGVTDSQDLLDPETTLTRFEVERLLQHPNDAA